jgi:hypothetical protein
MKVKFYIWQKRNKPEGREKMFSLKQSITLDENQLQNIVADHWKKQHESDINEDLFSYEGEIDQIELG